MTFERGLLSWLLSFMKIPLENLAEKYTCAENIKFLPVSDRDLFQTVARCFSVSVGHAHWKWVSFWCSRIHNFFGFRIFPLVSREERVLTRNRKAINNAYV